MLRPPATTARRGGGGSRGRTRGAGIRRTKCGAGASAPTAHRGAPPGGCALECALVRMRGCVVGVLERWDETCRAHREYFPWLTVV